MRRFDPSKLIDALTKPLNCHTVPKGWSSIEDIRRELNLAYTRNASSRALQLHRQGLLERMPHQFKANTGQCHKAYVYRPRKPFKTIKEAAEKTFEARSEKVPKAYVRIMDFATTAGVSHVAIRGRVERAMLKPRYFKTARGIAGLHLNAYYLKSELTRLYSKRS